MEIYVESIYLTEISDFVTKTFKPLTEKKNLKLNIEIQEGIPDSISTDSQRLMQILKNLLSNAIKFTSQGSVTLKIGKPDKNTMLQNEKLSIDNSIAFSVIDTGIGISNKKLNAILKHFNKLMEQQVVNLEVPDWALLSQKALAVY